MSTVPMPRSIADRLRRLEHKQGYHAQNLPTGWNWSNQDPTACVQTTNAYPFATDGREWIWKLTLTRQVRVNNLGILVVAAFSGMSHSVAGILDKSRNVLAISADSTTATYAANTIRSWAMGTPLTLQPGTYYAYLALAGTTKGNIVATAGSATALAAINGGGGCGTLTTAPWTPPVLGATIATIANSANVIPWTLLS